MTEELFSITPFYPGLKAKVRNKSENKKIKFREIRVMSVNFHTKEIEGELFGYKYGLDDIIEFIPPLCPQCGAVHHPKMTTIAQCH